MLASVHLKVAGILALAVLIPAAQEIRKEKTKPATRTVSPTLSSGWLSGRVFAITKGGDLKPARMADVYLFLESKISGSRVVESKGELTPMLVYLDKTLELMKETNSDRIAKYSEGLEISEEYAQRVSCRHDLLVVDKAIFATMDWANREGRKGLVRSTETDEDGHFRLGGIRSGKYDIIVRGQAGSNDVYWEQDVWIQPGEAVTVKVSSVKNACQKLD